jgi:hypothetical protein
MNESPSQTTLSDEDYERCLQIAVEYVAQHQSIRNRQLRVATGLNYDQVITFFNRAIKTNHLIRKGKGSCTHYVKWVNEM